MDTHSVAEAKAKLSEILDAVEHGHPQTITRRGKPVAKLVPADAVVTSPRKQIDVAALRRQIQQLKESGAPVVDSDAFLKDWKNEQRY
jgi:prevent-host-death family protein